MFKEIVTENEVKFNDLEKKIFKFVCSASEKVNAIINKFHCNKTYILLCCTT